jgi:3-deoxy-D-arabino-heptulosonate 7-phosphate (DAHP) synthase class II
MASTWSAQSWRAFPVTQAVTYPAVNEATVQPADPAAWRRKKDLAEVVNKLEMLPPLVSAVEVGHPLRST